MHPATGKTEDYQDPSLGLGTVFVCKDRSEDVSLAVGEGGWMDLRTSGTSASNAANGILFSLIHPGQDFFRAVTILRTSGMKKLD